MFIILRIPPPMVFLTLINSNALIKLIESHAICAWDEAFFFGPVS